MTPDPLISLARALPRPPLALVLAAAPGGSLATAWAACASGEALATLLEAADPRAAVLALLRVAAALAVAAPAGDRILALAEPVHRWARRGDDDPRPAPGVRSEPLWALMDSLPVEDARSYLLAAAAWQCALEAEGPRGDADRAARYLIDALVEAAHPFGAPFSRPWPLAAEVYDPWRAAADADLADRLRALAPCPALADVVGGARTG